MIYGDVRKKETPGGAKRILVQGVDAKGRKRRMFQKCNTCI